MSKAYSARALSITTKLMAGIAGLAPAILPAWSAAQTPVSDFSAPFVFGRFSVPKDNAISQEAFQLGRRLFYDPVLSGDNDTSCATCHRQELAFTDGLA